MSSKSGPTETTQLPLTLSLLLACVNFLVVLSRDGEPSTTMSQVPFQLLELTVISAQDLAPVTRKNLRTYAVLWVHHDRKLRTRIDQQGQINPTWNDKFVFRVDEAFLTSDTSAVMIEIYALGWLRDVPVGSVRILITNLIPPAVREQNNSSRRFVALQIRRPSGRPQGILNMGVTLLDNTMRSMPIYTVLSASAFGYNDLMEEKNHKKYDRNGGGENHDDKDENEVDKTKAKPPVPQLRRSNSDRTDLHSIAFPNKPHKPGSVYNGSVPNGSVVNGSVVNGSMLNGSEIGVNMRPLAGGNGSICSDVGPSPSIVAAAVAKGLYPTPMPAPHKPGSSILGDWTVEETSVEGLKSKIERWRMELPTIYDRRRAYQKSKSTKSTSRHSRRHTDDGGGGGLFSCFGNAYGCEFSIVCGANGNGNGSGSRRNSRRYGSSSSKVHFSPSELDSL